MITTEVEFLRSLCDTLGLLLVEESPDGSVRANDKARDELGSVRQRHLVEVISRLVGRRRDRATMEEKVSKTRAGTHEVYVDDRGRKLLLAPLSEGRVAAIITPPDPGQTSCTRLAAVSVDDVTAGLSHELANAVGAISGWAKLAKEGKRVDEALELIENTANTAMRIARQMLGRPRDKVGGESVVDISELTEECVRLLAPRAAQAGVTIVHDVSSGLMIRGSRDHVWSIIWNPLINAIEALEQGGTLTVGLAIRGDLLILTITDNGPGMDAETRSKLFQSRFTTKRTGNGLGLKLVKQTVENLGGSIQVASTKGRGTRIQIDLPAAREGVYEKRSAGKTPPRRRIVGKILVVDDDPAMRELIATALSIHGTEVLTASNACEAIEIRGEFDLALVDIRLPDRSGEALLSELVKTGKARAGLLVSGTDMPLGDPYKTPEFHLLRKPFQLDDLYDHVAVLLEDSRIQRVYAANRSSIN